MLIDSAKETWLTTLREYRAVTYYEFVMIAGHKAFKKGKEAIV